MSTTTGDEAREAADRDGTEQPPPSTGRGCGIVVASAVAPGSGHVLLGHRRTGWLILGSYLIVVAGAAALGVLAWRSWETVVVYALRPGYLSVLNGTLGVLAALWVLVVLHAGWTVLRRTRRTAAKVLAGGLAVALCAVIASPVVVLSRYVGTTNELIDGVFGPDLVDDAPAGPTRERFSDPVFADGRLNVLLIGGDVGDGREGLRADTVILASTEVASGRTVLVSLPRNLEDFPFARGSVMARQFPRGYRSCGFPGPHGCLLNSVYTWGQRHQHLFPDDKNPGATALSSAVAGILGQPVEYWALVDIRGFRRVIDAVGGVTVRVDQRLPIGGGGGPITGYLEPGLRRLDGHDALVRALPRGEPARRLRPHRPAAVLDRRSCASGATADPPAQLPEAGVGGRRRRGHRHQPERAGRPRHPRPAGEDPADPQPHAHPTSRAEHGRPRHQGDPLPGPQGHRGQHRPAVAPVTRPHRPCRRGNPELTRARAGEPAGRAQRRRVRQEQPRKGPLLRLLLVAPGKVAGLAWGPRHVVQLGGNQLPGRCG